MPEKPGLPWFVSPFILLLLALLLSACAPAATPTTIPTPTRSVASTPRPTPTLVPGPSVTTGKVTATVVEVIDGDTIDIDLGGTKYRVRYIGIDTPETKHPQVGLECFGAEATQRNRELVEGQTVYLETDVSETDQYGRLLRYVWLADGRMVNDLLVAEGYAQVTTYPPDVKHTDRFLADQRQAREIGKGLWAACGEGAPTPDPLTSTEVRASTPAPATGNCEPAYPDVCITPPPPDLSCSDIPHKRFKVLPPDPHRFDGDHNGVGCEQ